MLTCSQVLILFILSRSFMPLRMLRRVEADTPGRMVSDERFPIEADPYLVSIRPSRVPPFS